MSPFLKNIVPVICSIFLIDGCSHSSNASSGKSFIQGGSINPDGSFDRKTIMMSINANKQKWETTREMGEMQYTLRYEPKEFLALMEAGTNAPDSIVVRDIGHYSGLKSFNLRIQVDGFEEEPIKYKVKGESAYDERVKYCAFGMQNDIILVLDDKDTIPCKLFHFERMFDAQPVCSFMIGFPQDLIDKKDKDYSNMTVIYFDRLFNKGILKFRFDRNDIETLQQITSI